MTASFLQASETTRAIRRSPNLPLVQASPRGLLHSGTGATNYQFAYMRILLESSTASLFSSQQYATSHPRRISIMNI